MKSVSPRTYLVFALLWMAAIFALSAVPDDRGSSLSRTVLFLPPQWQNLLHVPLFFGLAWLWAQALPGRHPGWAAAIAAVYGLTDEFHQLYVPGRFGSVTDVLLDGLGALLALVWCLRVRRGR